MKTTSYKDLIVWQKFKKRVFKKTSPTSYSFSTRYSLNSKFSQKGFSLLELLIYIAIFGTVVLATANVLVTVFEGRDSTNARYEVLQNIRFASEKIRQLVYDTSSSTVSGVCPFNVLEVIIGGATTTVTINNGILQTVSGGNTNILTSNLVTATSTDGNCLFVKISNPLPAKPTLQFQFSISYNNNGNQQLKFSDSIKTTISQR